MPTNTPTVSDEYTSFVIRASTSARIGGTIDHRPVAIRSNPSITLLPFAPSPAKWPNARTTDGHKYIRVGKVWRRYRPGNCAEWAEPAPESPSRGPERARAVPSGPAKEPKWAFATRHRRKLSQNPGLVPPSMPQKSTLVPKLSKTPGQLFPYKRPKGGEGTKAGFCDNNPGRGVTKRRFGSREGRPRGSAPPARLR